MQLSDTNTPTLDGIQQDIYFLGKCNVNSFVAGDLNRIINKYYKQLQEAIRSVNENFYMTVATADLVTTTNGSYTFPDGTGSAPAYEKIKSIWAAFAPANIAAPLPTEFIRVNCIDPDSISDPAYTFSNENPMALMFGSYFVLQPILTANAALYPVTGGVKTYYIPVLSKLVNATDVPNIFPDFHDAITQGSLIDVGQRLGNMQLKQDSIAFFKKRLEDIKAYASNRIPDELAIVEGQDTTGGWDYPFGRNSMA